MIILGIESSCDETAVAIVRDGRDLLANQIRSQIELHRVHGGVVPELASRCHLEAIHPLLQAALDEAGMGWNDIEGLAVTQGPGLSGALIVGLVTAQSLAWLLEKPLMGVHHLEGHIYANFLAFGAKIKFPLLVLLVSGGHTQLIEMRGHGDYTLVGSSRDDAIGEAFDKVARLLGLPYPGGPAIDKMARSGNPAAFAFPRSLPESWDFSFSGLKTAVLYKVQDLKAQGQELPVADLCASFQQAAIEAVIGKALRYAQERGIGQISVTGGVSANSALRRLLDQTAAAAGIETFLPPLSLCTDNAAMIAACACYRWQPAAELKLAARPRWRLGEV
ncbi:MAG: tRNA (adenosine(37)-N6)-threonylcarbamoyltransferase complex transferase subunit TsaD [Candidatus Sericytochromatia bacterium]